MEKEERIKKLKADIKKFNDIIHELYCENQVEQAGDFIYHVEKMEQELAELENGDSE